MATVDRERQLRRRRRRERQAVVFGSLIAGLSVAALAAAGSYTGAIDLPFLDREFASPEPDDALVAAPVPCPPEGALPVAYADIQVNVLNGAGVVGLAGQTSEQLSGRGFTVLSTGNYPTTLPTAGQVHFGANGTSAAYTLAAHLIDPVLVLDLREDATVDLVVGEAFTTLSDLETVTLDPAIPLEGTADCVPLADALVDAAPAPTPTPPAADATEG